MNPNPRFNPPSTPRAIRTQIDSTRQRMDQKIDAIGERLKGRHLVDEVMGIFRGHNGDGNSTTGRIASKITESAGSAVHTAIDSVKSHPLPALLIGAGIAWLAYESSRETPVRRHRDYDEAYGYDGPDPDSGDASPPGYSPLGFNEAESFGGTMPDDGGGHPVQAARPEGFDSESGIAQDQSTLPARRRIQKSTRMLRERAGEIRSRVSERTEAIYRRSRDEVARVADRHPIETGLGLLGLGLLAGLALPTPRKAREIVGPTAGRIRGEIRGRADDLMQRGKQVIRAAVTAGKDEADAQGLTPSAMSSARASEASTTSSPSVL